MYCASFYRAKLEQAYRLCPRCERRLKIALNRVKTNILGSKWKQIGAKGLYMFDLNMDDKTYTIQIYRKRDFCSRISLIALTYISLLHFYVSSNQTDITKTKLDTVFDASTSTWILTILSYISAINIMIGHFVVNIITLPYISLFVSCLRFFIQYIYICFGGDLWSIVNVELTNLIEPTDTIDKSINFSTVLLNISGCFISMFLLFLHGLEIGPIFLLLLWSCNAIMPTLVQGTTDLPHLLIFDSIQVRFQLFSFERFF